MIKYYFIVILIPLMLCSNKVKKKNILFPDAAEPFQDSVWICKTELSNGNYLEYLNASIVDLTVEEAVLLEPNKFLWNSIKNKPKPYQDYYFRHPAYDNYPVVNITREQAVLFCKWKTKELNSYLQSIPEKEKQGVKEVIVRFPQEKEWKYAALGGLPSYSNYPWKGLGMREEKGKEIGLFRANFKDNIGEIRVGKKMVLASEDLIAPVNSFYQNGFGLYNMSGNVAEMIEDKYVVRGGHWNSFKDGLRLNVYEQYTGASPTVGFRYVIEKVK